MEMYFKKNNCIVEVYNFFEDRTALIFNPSIAGKQQGNGWDKVKVSTLIPIEYTEYIDEHRKGFMSKTERNKIKERLVLTKAEWTCTDGTIFDNCNEAIIHEKEIMNKEVNDA